LAPARGIPQGHRPDGVLLLLGPKDLADGLVIIHWNQDIRGTRSRVYDLCERSTCRIHGSLLLYSQLKRHGNTFLEFYLGLPDCGSPKL
jgi:hypothetical protein